MGSPLNVIHSKGLLERDKSKRGRMTREWSDKKRRIGKFCSLWWCWKENVRDRQFMPLVKFFHCVSFLNQTLLWSSSFSPSSDSFCLFCYPIQILFLSFYASFSFLSGPLHLLPLSPCFISSHFTFPVFYLFLTSHLQILFAISCSFVAEFSAFPPLNPFFSCWFCHDSVSHLLGGWILVFMHANHIKKSYNIWPSTWPVLSCRDQSVTLAGP